MGIQSRIQNVLSAPRQKLEQSMYAHLGSGAVHKVNQGDATPGSIRRVENPHTGQPLKRFPRCTEAQAKMMAKKAEIIEKRHNNGVQFLKSKEKIEQIETKEHGMMTDYRIGRLDRELAEQKANANLAQHASQMIPEYAVMRGETTLVRNEAIYDASTVAQEFLVVKGW